MKHALLLALLDRLTRAAAPLSVLETHAGAGVYDLAGAAARASGEAASGVVRLMADRAPPGPLERLRAEVAALNRGGELRRYPGSPWLSRRALRPQDRYVGCELRPDDFAALQASLADGSGSAAELVQGDGFVEAERRLRAARGRTLLLIDPPYERSDDYARVAELVAARPAPDRQPALIWTPLKDLETFDAFLGRLEAPRPGSLLAAQVRLRPLHDPMRMNGCALVLVDGADVTEEAQAICGWAADRLGEAGAGARVERFVN